MKHLKLITIVTLIAGTIDIVLACLDAYLFNNVKPEMVLRYITSAIKGKEAFIGDSSNMHLGLFLHYAITFGCTLFYAIMLKYFKVNSFNKYAVAIVFGGLIWCFMNLLVLPASQAPPLNLTFLNSVKSIIIQVLGIGIPIVFLFVKYSNE